MRHQERIDVQQLKLPSKKSWNPSHLKVLFRHLATQHENVQKRKGKVLTEPQAVKRLKSELMTREKKKVAKKHRVAPDLREKKLQVEKRPNAGNAEQIVKKRKGLKQPKASHLLKRSEEACEEGFRIHFT